MNIVTTREDLEGKPFISGLDHPRKDGAGEHSLVATSSEPGDKAIITADGDLTGWVGGSCAQPTVVKEAQGAIADGEPRLVVITPNPAEQAREGAILYHMSCYSGGTLEIHIEPYLPEPQLGG